MLLNHQRNYSFDTYNQLIVSKRMVQIVHRQRRPRKLPLRIFYPQTQIVLSVLLRNKMMDLDIIVVPQ